MDKKAKSFSIKQSQRMVLSILEVVERICCSNNIKYSLAYGSVLGAVRHKGFIPWDSDVDIIIPISEVESFRTAMQNGLPQNMCLHKRGEKKYHPCFDRISYKDISHEAIHVDVFALCGLPDVGIDRNRFINKCYFIYHILCCKRKSVRYSHKNKKLFIIMLKALLFFIPDSLINYLYNKMLFQYPYNDCQYVSTLVSPYKQKDFMDKSKLMEVIRVPFEGLSLPIPKDFDAYLTHIYGDYMTPRKY